MDMVSGSGHERYAGLVGKGRWMSDDALGAHSWLQLAFRVVRYL